MSEPNVNAIPTSRAAGRSRTHKVTVTAMLSAVAFLLMFIEFPIPALIPSFVKLDISDLPELLAAFSLGPVYGIAVTFLKNLLFALLHGTSSAYVGELFNFIMGSVFSFSAGFLYQRNKSRKGALLGSVLGAALMAFLGAELKSGIEIVTTALNLEEHIHDCTLVITGEGRIDSQSIHGKVPIGVANVAKKYHKPVIGIAGSLTNDVGVVHQHGIDAVFSVLTSIGTLDEAFRGAYDNICRASRNIAATLAIGMRNAG